MTRANFGGKMRKSYYPILALFIISFSSYGQVNQTTEKIVEEMIKEKTANSFNTTEFDQKNARSIFEESGAEPFIAIDPNDEDKIGIIFMGDARKKVLFLSDDGGITWEESTLNTIGITNELYPTHSIIGGGDPLLIFDDEHAIHVTWIYLHGTDFVNPYNNIMETFYAVSSDFGTTWETRSSVHSGVLSTYDAIDRIWMDCDYSGGDNNNSIYLSGVHFTTSATGEDGQLVFKKNSDSSFFNPIGTLAIDPEVGAQTQYGNLAVDGFGNVHVVAAIIGGENEKIVYTKSIDGGTTFSTQQIIREADLITTEPETSIHNRENPATSIAVDENNVYLSWNETQDDITKAYYVYSHDNGESFSDPIEFANSINGDYYASTMPCLSADDDYLVISWYLYDKETKQTRYLSAYSNDAGLTFSAFQTLSEEPTDFGTLPSSQFYGDYNSSTMLGCTAHFAWADGRSGSPKVYHTSVNACSIGEGEASISEYTPVTEQLKIKSLYPNPASQQINLSIYSDRERELQLTVKRIDSKLIEQIYATHSLSTGNQTIELEVSKYPAGQYLLLGTTNDGYMFTRLWTKQ